MLSPHRRRALNILHPEHPLHPEIFAHYMWPASPSWRRASRPGQGIHLKARTFLARLQREGLAELRVDAAGGSPGYVLTEGGERFLD